MDIPAIAYRCAQFLDDSKAKSIYKALLAQCVAVRLTFDPLKEASFRRRFEIVKDDEVVGDLRAHTRQDTYCMALQHVGKFHSRVAVGPLAIKHPKVLEKQPGYAEGLQTFQCIGIQQRERDSKQAWIEERVRYGGL
ncbi:MAG: hypothetical protein ABT00_09050 [Bordetella sp. SCN 68-11]|nr:MAG: hypothetical protein ABT00_09050 [Bordetella sp. SCN 68-11]OJX33874.1 MAG: hypothetical protein BGO75_14970 [Burkholderiales bacterium 68-20]